MSIARESDDQLQTSVDELLASFELMTDDERKVFFAKLILERDARRMPADLAEKVRAMKFGPKLAQAIIDTAVTSDAKKGG